MSLETFRHIFGNVTNDDKNRLMLAIIFIG